MVDRGRPTVAPLFLGAPHGPPLLLGLHHSRPFFPGAPHRPPCIWGRHTDRPSVSGDTPAPTGTRFWRHPQPLFLGMPASGNAPVPRRTPLFPRTSSDARFWGRPFPGTPVSGDARFWGRPSASGNVLGPFLGTFSAPVPGGARFCVSPRAQPPHLV